MGQALILAGGGLWLLTMIVLISYGAVQVAARNYRPAIVTLVCALFIAWAGAFAIGNAPHWAGQVWQ